MCCCCYCCCYLGEWEWAGYDGWYNNLAHPDWGGAGNTFPFNIISLATTMLLNYVYRQRAVQATGSRVL